MKYWEIVADKLSAAGWSRGYCSAVTRQGRRWVVDAFQTDENATSSNLTSYWGLFWSWSEQCVKI